MDRIRFVNSMGKVPQLLEILKRLDDLRSKSTTFHIVGHGQQGQVTVKKSVFAEERYRYMLVSKEKSVLLAGKTLLESLQRRLGVSW